MLLLYFYHRIFLLVLKSFAASFSFIADSIEGFFNF